MKTMKIVIFSIWLILTVIWNYKLPNVLPYEDVFAATCLLLFANSLRKELAE